MTEHTFLFPITLIALLLPVAVHLKWRRTRERSNCHNSFQILLVAFEKLVKLYVHERLVRFTFTHHSLSLFHYSLETHHSKGQWLETAYNHENMACHRNEATSWTIPYQYHITHPRHAIHPFTLLTSERIIWDRLAATMAPSYNSAAKAKSRIISDRHFGGNHDEPCCRYCCCWSSNGSRIQFRIPGIRLCILSAYSKHGFQSGNPAISRQSPFPFQRKTKQNAARPEML